MTPASSSRAAAVAKYGETLVFTFDDVTSDLRGVSKSSMVQTVRLCIGNTSI